MNDQMKKKMNVCMEKILNEESKKDYWYAKKRNE